MRFPCAKSDLSDKAILLLLLPLLVLVLQLLVGGTQLSVYIYQFGNVRYSIAALSYSVNGISSPDGAKFLYAPPATWRSPVDFAPTLLLLHFVLGVLLAVYLLILTIIGWRTAVSSLGNGLRFSGTLIHSLTGLMILLTTAMWAGDAAFWGQAKAAGNDFKPDALGQAVIVVSAVVTPIWAVVWVLVLRERSRAIKKTNEQAAVRRSRSSRSQGGASRRR